MKRKLSIGILCCAVAGLLSVCAVGCTEEDAPNNPAPVLILDDAGNITRTTATVSGQIEGNRKSVRSCGFMYSTAKSDLQVSSDSGASVQEVAVAETGAITATLANLQAGTTYHYCFFAVSGVTKVLSEIKEFKTTTTSAPVLGPIVQKEVDGTDVTLQCQILDKGGADLTQFGFEYKKINETSYTSKYLTAFDEGSSDTFTMTLMLEGGVTYEIRAVAINTSPTESTGYSEIIRIETDDTAPVLTTVDVETNDIGANWVRAVGQITDKKGGVLQECGFLWSTTNETPTIGKADGQYAVEEASDLFSATLTGLRPNTRYFLRAYAQSKVGNSLRNGYGQVIVFTTTNFGEPVLSEVTITDKTVTSARVTCTITSTGNGTITEKGFYYSSTNKVPTSSDNVITVSGDEITFSALLEDLAGGKNYYVRAYAISRISDGEEAKTGYSKVATVQTMEYVTPTMDAPVINTVMQHTATLSATVNLGNVTILKKGFCWSTESTPTITSSTSSQQEIIGSEFTLNVDGLKSNTRYYVRAYVTYQTDKEFTVYSNQSYFTTMEFKVPTFSSLKVTDVTLHTALASVSIAEQGDGEILQKGFVWGTSSQLTMDNCVGKSENTETGNSFSHTIEDLIAYQTYYVAAYAITKLDQETRIVYSYSLYFNTLPYTAPSFSSLNVNYTRTTATFSSQLSAGDATIIEKGFCWNTTGTPTVADSKQEVAGDTFTTTIEGLTPGTRYYWRAYAIYKYDNGEQSTIYSGIGNFTTNTMTQPSISISLTPAIYTITASAQVTGGEGEITERGFCWSKSQYPTLEEGAYEGYVKLVDGADFTYTIENLIPGTYYYVRAYVKSTLDVETAITYSDNYYGHGVCKTEDLQAASVRNPTRITVSENSFTVSSSFYSEGNTEVTEVGFCWTTDNNMSPVDISVSNRIKTEKQDDGTFTAQVTGLASGVTYYVYAYGVNSAGTAYSGSTSITTTFIPGKEDNPSPDK